MQFLYVMRAVMPSYASAMIVEECGMSLQNLFSLDLTIYQGSYQAIETLIWRLTLEFSIELIMILQNRK